MASGQDLGDDFWDHHFAVTIPTVSATILHGQLCSQGGDQDEHCCKACVKAHCKFRPTKGQNSEELGKTAKLEIRSCFSF